MKSLRSSLSVPSLKLKAFFTPSLDTLNEDDDLKKRDREREAKSRDLFRSNSTERIKRTQSTDTLVPPKRDPYPRSASTGPLPLPSYHIAKDTASLSDSSTTSSHGTLSRSASVAGTASTTSTFAATQQYPGHPAFRTNASAATSHEDTDFAKAFTPSDPALVAHQLPQLRFTNPTLYAYISHLVGERDKVEFGNVQLRNALEGAHQRLQRAGAVLDEQRLAVRALHKERRALLRRVTVLRKCLAENSRALMLQDGRSSGGSEPEAGEFALWQMMLEQYRGWVEELREENEDLRARLAEREQEGETDADADAEADEGAMEAADDDTGSTTPPGQPRLKRMKRQSALHGQFEDVVF